MPVGLGVKGEAVFVRINRTKERYKAVTRFADQRVLSGGPGRPGL